MKTYFKDIYLPVKNGITGEILKESNSKNNELISQIIVKYDPDKPIGKWFINVVFVYQNSCRRYYFGRTQKEIRELVKYINDFKFNPYLFLNQ